MASLNARTPTLNRLDARDRMVVVWHSEIITALLINEGLRSIYFVASRDAAIGPATLRNELIRSIAQFGRDLVAENPLFEGVGLCLQMNGLASSFAARDLTDASLENDASLDLDTSQIDVVQGIMEGNAYLNFGRRIFGLLLPVHATRIINAVGQIAFGEDGKLMPLVSPCLSVLFSGSTSTRRKNCLGHRSHQR